MKPAESPRLVHLELHTAALRDARSFCADLFGWRGEEIETASGSYHALDLGGAIGGGIVECPAPRPIWLPYVEVRDIREMTDRARLLGAEVLLEPREGPAGWRSVVNTPSCGEMALWHSKH